LLSQSPMYVDLEGRTSCLANHLCM